MTEDNQNNEFKPQPLPGQVFIRPGIDDRPDYEKTMTPEAKAHRLGRWSAPNRGRAS